MYKIKEGRMSAGVYIIKNEEWKLATDVYKIKKRMDPRWRQDCIKLRKGDRRLGAGVDNFKKD